MPGTRFFFIACGVIALVLLIVLTAGAIGASSTPVPQAVDSGWAVWRENGCAMCHTLYGQGGIYGPDLTHIVNQRGGNYIREFLVNPNAFHPGERMMPRFTLTVAETDHLLAFLGWVGQTEAAATWPPRPIHVAGLGGVSAVAVADEAQSGSDDPVARGRALFSSTPAICSTCHSLEPDVVIVGPSLAGIATRAADRVQEPDVPQETAAAYLRNSIINPGDYVVEGFSNAMAQNLAQQLSSQEINDIIAFLMILDGEGSS